MTMALTGMNRVTVLGIRHRMMACLGTVCSVLLLVGLCSGCGGESGEPSASLAREVPVEIKSRLAALEQAWNNRRSDEYGALLDERASVQSVALLGYGGKAQVVEAMRGQLPQEQIRFAEVEVVSSRPDRIRTLSTVEVVRGGERSTQRVAHDWVRRGEAWLIREQSYPDWAPIVGIWRRGEGVDAVSLRVLPGGGFEMQLGEGLVALRSGTYTIDGDRLLVDTDAVGAGGTGEGRLRYRFDFEFDGTLTLELVDGIEDLNTGSMAGSWRRAGLGS